MRKVFLLTGLAVFLAAAGVLAQDAKSAPPPSVGWFLISPTHAPEVQAALDKAKAALDRLPVRWVSRPEIEGFLRELDRRKGILGEAGRRLTEGRELALGMKLPEAQAAFQAAIAVLERGSVTVYDPGRVAEPWLELGVTQFQANQKDEARQAFARAVALAPGLRLAEGYYSPSVREAFERARAEVAPQGPPSPLPEDLARICQEASLNGLVVVAVERLGDRPLLRLSLFEARERRFRAVETALLSERAAAAEGQAAGERLTPPLAQVAGVAFLPVQAVTPPPRPVDEPPPWYTRHWWIWPVAAAVVGAAVVLPLTVFRKDVVEIHVQY